MEDNDLENSNCGVVLERIVMWGFLIMVAFTSAWEDRTILPLLRSEDKEKILNACKLLVDDDTGDVDEVKVELAGLLIRVYT